MFLFVALQARTTKNVRIKSMMILLFVCVFETFCECVRNETRGSNPNLSQPRRDAVRKGTSTTQWIV